MPNYNIRNKKTGKIVQQLEMTIAETDDWEKANPDLEIAVGAPLIHSGTGLKKPDQGFRDVLRTIKKGNSKGFYRSTVNTF
jgi:hypothetical protein